MAKSTLVVYEPLTSITDKSYYWTEYVKFYEQYWGGPTSPFGVWFGNEYESFLTALSSRLEVDKDELEHCFFTKDEEGKYYVAPFSSKANLFFSENFIPLEWFIPFREKDRQTLYTHWGFNALHYDTKIKSALERLKKAEEIISEVSDKAEFQQLTSARIAMNLLQGTSELESWLSGFDPGGFIVLNYGEVCSVINPYTLENERSVGETWKFLESLNSGSFSEADSTLKVLVRKWEDIRNQASGDADKSTLQ
ncbi:MAG: hypothetical protein RIG61_03535 [Deltaproteobacteria bacterium]